MFLQWVFAKEDAEPLPVIVLELFQDGKEVRAGETFEVAEFFQLDRRFGFAAKMRRLSAGAAISHFRRALAAIMKKQPAGHERCNKDARNDEKRKRPAHALTS